MATNMILGKNLLVFVDSTTSVKPIAFATSAKLSTSLKTIDKTTKDSGDWVEVDGDQFNWTISSDSLVTFDTLTGAKNIEDIWGLYEGKTPVNVTLGIKDGTAPGWTVKTGTKAFKGQGLITSLSVNADKDGIATYSIEITGSGKLDIELISA